MSESVNVLLIGGGGREHALARSLAASPRLGRLYITHPENPGLSAIGTPVNVPVNIREIYRLEQFCDRARVGLVVIGPEGPLSEGYADRLSAPKRAVFGPIAAGARLESDKAWAKQLLRSASVPTADARVFDNHDRAKAYVETRDEPIVIKASGLAAGKGVVLPETTEEALAELERFMVEKVFGEAGRTVVIEERLEGPEVSVFALTDGRSISVLDVCQDHKRLLDGDRGPNTGGMGAFCPSPLVDGSLMAEIERDILVPTVDALKRDGIDYRGVLYAGLILTAAGPKVLEYNVRFGDPEAQVLLPRLRTDLIELALATAERRLDEVELETDRRAACTVVLASEGYPEKPRTGVPITGVEDAEGVPGAMVFHAGTRRDEAGGLVTAGGRVLSVTGMADTLADARRIAYEASSRIHFDGVQMRRDIAKPVSKRSPAVR